MPPEAVAGAATVHLFAVEATRAEAAAFRAAVGAPADAADDVLPLTFPMRWLASPTVRGALAATVPEPDLVPVHEAQDVEVAQPLRVGRPYTLRLAVRREAEPPRLVADAAVEDEAGVILVRLATVLRLVSTGAGA